MKRIVTSNAQNGRSFLESTQTVPPGAIWEAALDRPLGWAPTEPRLATDVPPGHIVCANVEIPPDAVMREFLRAGIPGLDENGFHRTGTLDFVVLIEGQLALELDDASVELSPGNVVVQRDTNHAWRNPGPNVARCVAVLCKWG